MKLERDDFDLWRSSPITEMVMAALARLSEAAKQKWLDESWGKGNTDPVLLADLRARAEVVDDLTSLNFEDMETLLEE